MLGQGFQFCNIAKIMAWGFIVILTIRINSILGYFAETNAFASHTFCCNVKSAYTRKKIYESKFCHYLSV